MCGFSILINKGEDYNDHVIRNMTRSIIHRGPNNFGFSNETLGDFEVNIGHARLSIIDLQENSNQPFLSKCKQVSLVFNGEIYNNFQEIKKELKSLGILFNTNSDTEVLLESYLFWGEKCLNKFNGMFSFAILDKRRRKLFVARDRFGVKPLYFSKINQDEILFSSEIKQFFFHPKVNKAINSEAFFRFLFQKSHKFKSESFFKNIFEVNHGELITICLKKPSISLKKTWYMPELNQIDANESGLEERFFELFDDAVKLRLNADVPVGTGLSGGLDSSSIVCHIKDLIEQKKWNHPLKTFSSRFLNHELDEGDYIQSVVSQTMSNHEEIFPEGSGLLDELEIFSWHHDEPVLTSAVYAQWCAYKLVSQFNVKVTLDGHGADEILGGYKSFFRPLLFDHLKNCRLRDFFDESNNLTKMYKYPSKTPYLWMLSSIFGSSTSLFYKSFFGKKRIQNKWFKQIDSILDKRDPQEITNLNRKNFKDYSKDMLFKFSMPPQLQWADRNSMAFSVESRAPFLDYRLVEFCLSLPNEYKLGGGINKIILRNTLGNKLPSKVVERKYKQGFESPEESWLLNKNNHEIVKSLIDDSREINNDFLHEDSFKYCNQIINKEFEYDEFLWRMISLSQWRKTFNI